MEKRNSKYEMEELRDEFKRHNEDRESALDFNLPLALKSIVEEVIEIKRCCEDERIRNMLMMSGSRIDKEESLCQKTLLEEMFKDASQPQERKKINISCEEKHEGIDYGA